MNTPNVTAFNSTQNVESTVCFISFDAAPLIFPNASGCIGGAETRALLMARTLSEVPKVRVVVVIRDSRERPRLVVDGFTVITKVDRLFRIRRFVSEHVTVLNSFPWINVRRWHSKLIWQIPLLFFARLFRKRTDPDDNFHWLTDAAHCDVYACMGVSERTAQIFTAVRKLNRKTVLFIASDFDLEDFSTTVAGPETQNDFNADLRVDAIRSADVIVCQTDRQQQMLTDRFGRDSFKFPNPFDHDDWLRKLGEPYRMPAEIPSRFALWIGRSDRHHKRPEILLQVAGTCPEVYFVMIMNTQDESIAVDVRRHCPPNIVIIEYVPFHEMPFFFQMSAMLVSTGSKEAEGFPNVFLQAAATSVPIVSLEVDPGFVASRQAGIVCHGDSDQLAREVQALWGDTERSRQLGLNGQMYMRENHSTAEARKHLLAILDSVL